MRNQRGFRVKVSSAYSGIVAARRPMHGRRKCSMSLFDILWPGEFGWKQLLTGLASLVPGIFLLLLAGVASTQLPSRPREARLLLIAIVLQLTSWWGLDRVFTFALKFCYDVAGFRSLWIGFGLNAISTLLGLLLSGLCWWCIILAALGQSRPSPHVQAATENNA